MYLHVLLRQRVASVTYSPVTPPSQRKLASIVHHNSRVTVYSTLYGVDDSIAADATRVRRRETTRFIAVS